MNRCALALTLLTLSPATADAAPRTVAVVLDAPPDDRAALDETARAAHGVLYGLAAVGDPERVVVRVVTPGGISPPTTQASAWLGEVDAWARGARKPKNDADSKGLRAAVGHLNAQGIERVVLIDAKGGDALDRSLKPELDGYALTALTLDGDVEQALCGSDEPSPCEVFSVGDDQLGAVQSALVRALDGVSGVWVTTAVDALDLPAGTLRAVAIAPGEKRPLADAEALIIADGPPGDRLMTGALLRWPAGDAKLTLAEGVDRALVVGVRAQVEVVDCDLRGEAQPRWALAGAGPETVAGTLRFAVSGHGSLSANADGTVALPEGLVGAFTMKPLWARDNTPAGPLARCRVEPAMRARATLSVALVDGSEGGALEVRVAFHAPDGRVMDPAALLAHLPALTVSGGPRAELTAADGGAVARVPLPAPGTHTVQLPAVATRHLLLEGSRVEVRVESSTVGEASWWPAPVAAGLVLIGLLGYPMLLGALRRRQRPRVGSVQVSVGGSPVIDRRIGPNTAFPAMLVGVRDIPIADGEILARAEVCWDGLRPMVVATVMGRPDANGRCTPRLEQCPLDDARPFTFSNVRIEFVENG